MQLFYFISLTKLHWKKCKNSKSSKNIAHHNFSLQVWWHKRRTYERTVKICAALTSSKVLIGHLTLLPKRYLRILSSVSVTNFDNYFDKIFKLCFFANLIKTVRTVKIVSIENQHSINMANFWKIIKVGNTVTSSLIIPVKCRS